MKKKLQPHEKRFMKTILAAVIILILPYIYYQPTYDELQETEIVVDWTYYSSGRRSIGSFVRTPDDTIYKVTGDISSRNVFEEALLPGATATIKYYRGIHIFFPMNFAKEVIVDDQAIATYTSSQGTAHTICTITSILFLTVGFLFYADSSHLFRKIRKKVQKHRKQDKSKK